VVVLNINATNIFAIDLCFIGNGTDDITRLDPVIVPDLYAESFHSNICGLARTNTRSC
jgi:hypothetical protein